ncbi:hypothetical protein PG987_014368 [Apiospora arundinis]
MPLAREPSQRSKWMRWHNNNNAANAAANINSKNEPSEIIHLGGSRVSSAQSEERPVTQWFTMTPPGTACCPERLPEIWRVQTASLPASLSHQLHAEPAAAQPGRGAQGQAAGPCTDPLFPPEAAVPLAYGCFVEFQRRGGLGRPFRRR